MVSVFIGIQRSTPAPWIPLMLCVVLACSPTGGTSGIPVARVLARLQATELVCGDPDPDPASTLVQWRCAGAIEGVATIVLVDGDDQGLFQLTIDLGGPGDLRDQISTFVALVRLTEVAAAWEEELIPWITAWDGTRDVHIISGQASASLLATGLRSSVLRINPGPRRSLVGYVSTITTVQ